MRILLFTGKGGVGKTTLAAATATRVAGQGAKVLVVSTDPAHSLADTLGTELGPQPRETELVGLCAAEVDTRTLVDGVWEHLREHLRTLLIGAGVADVDAEELTLLPGVEDLLALGEVQRFATSGLWDTIIVDCGPTAETLRLLALPEALAGYLERLFPTHRRVVRGLLAGVAGSDNVDRWDAVADGLGRLSERLEALRELLTEGGTTVRLICTPEAVVAAETRRTLTALALQGIHVDGLVANRMVPSPGSARGPAAAWLRARSREQNAVLDGLRSAMDVPVRTAEYHACEPIGIPALSELGAELYGAIDPLDGPERVPMLSVAGGGRHLDSEYLLQLSLSLPPEVDLDLARVGDELAVTVGGRRRLVALPAVLRRCIVTGALAGDDGVTVTFRPDPDLWMR